MTPATARSTVWTDWHWPDEARAFAAEHEVEGALEPLREALARLFPTARSAKVILELDPELRDDRHVTFKVDVPTEDIPDYVKACHACHDEVFRIVPTVKAWVFRVILYPID